MKTPKEPPISNSKIRVPFCRKVVSRESLVENDDVHPVCDRGSYDCL